MKIYTIGTKSIHVFGHGDTFPTVEIVAMGFYRTGEYPPAFTNREDAEKWLVDNPSSGNKIVSLELKG